MAEDLGLHGRLPAAFTAPGSSSFSDFLSQAAPDLLRLLDNFSAVARNTVDQRTELATFLRTTTVFTKSTDDFLRINERSLIKLAADSLPNLEVYRRYAPEFPCILHTLPGQELLGQKTFGGGVPGLHITLEVTRDQGAPRPQARPRCCQARECNGRQWTSIRPKPRLQTGRSA